MEEEKCINVAFCVLAVLKEGSSNPVGSITGLKLEI